MAEELRVAAEVSHYWQETLTREAALERLARRGYTRRQLRDLERRFPDSIDHLITLEGNLFREYAVHPDRAARLTLHMPIVAGTGEGRERRVAVLAPVFGKAYSRDRPFWTAGISIHTFGSRDGVLFHDGAPLPEFQWMDDPTRLEIDVAFISEATARRAQAPGAGPSECCFTCEVMHSILNIHDIDSWCCSGACGPMHFSSWDRGLEL